MDHKRYQYKNENIRKENTKKVISALITGNSMSRAEIAKKFALNKATVSDIIGGLLEEGLIIETGLGASTPTGGRKPVLLQINKYAGLLFSFEFQYNQYSFMATYFDGELIKTFCVSSPVHKDNITSIITDTVREFQSDPRYKDYKVFGIGIAVHGTVENNRIVFTPYYDIHKIELAEKVEEELGVPVTIENEANAFAVFEAKANLRFQNFLAVNISSGIGIGIIIDSLLYKGADGEAGEIGHTVLYPNGKPCSCGRNGCFEQYCSKQALLKDYRHLFPDRIASLSELKKNRDLPAVGALLSRYTSDLIIGLENLITAFSPEALILKSDIFSEFPELFSEVGKALHRRNKNIVIKLTDWKEYSTLFGGIILILQTYFSIPSFLLYSEKK